MADSAQIRSFEAIERLRAAFLFFASQSAEGLDELSSEMQRLLDWIEHDRPRFWKEQNRLAWDDVSKAKADLHRCLMYPIGDERPSCREERAALKKAQVRLAYCEEKAEKLRHWVREINHELHEYTGRTSRLVEVIEADAPQAAAALERILLTLEDYVRVGLDRRPGSPSAPAIGSESKSPADPTEKPVQQDPGLIRPPDIEPDDDEPQS